MNNFIKTFIMNSKAYPKLQKFEQILNKKRTNQYIKLIKLKMPGQGIFIRHQSGRFIKLEFDYENSSSMD